MQKDELTEGPHPPARPVQTCLVTPPRQRWTLAIWERDDEPDLVAIGVDAHDANGILLASWRGFAPRDEMYEAALTYIAAFVKEAWYETHAPFDG